MVRTGSAMFNEDPTLGLWAHTAQPAPPTARLVADIECDIVVIGAGYTGLSAALHAAQAGRRVVVVEAEDIGSGGSGRNVGLVNAGLWTLPDTVRATLGEPHGSRLISQLGEAPTLVYRLIEQHAIECTPVRNGTLHCARDAAGLTELAGLAANRSA